MFLFIAIVEIEMFIECLKIEKNVESFLGANDSFIRKTENQTTNILKNWFDIY